MKKLRVFSRMKVLALSVFYKDLEPGHQKRQLSVRALALIGGIALTVFVVGVFLTPSNPKLIGDFNEKLDPKAAADFRKAQETNIAQATAKLQSAFSAGHQNSGTGAGGVASSRQNPDRNSPMVIPRPGPNSANQLAAGLKFRVKLAEQVRVGEGKVPVIAVVSRGLFNDSGGGIEEESRVFGEITFQSGSERAQAQFTSIASPSGIVRTIQATAGEPDGEPGISGEIHSRNVRNIAGQVITRFIGAYADGSVQRDFLGASQGGAQNGLMTAVSQTAKDRAEAYAENLKKEQEWMALPAGKELTIILVSPFTFRDQGPSL